MSLKRAAYHHPYQERAPQLTAREREILGLVGRGMTNEAIAGALGVSVKTVKVHMEHIFDKVGVRDRYEAFHAQEALLPDP